MFIVFDSLVDDKGNSLRAAPASGASQTSGIFRFLCVSEQKRACRERTGGVYPDIWNLSLLVRIGTKTRLP